jgi:general secretion pathway protein M
LAPRERRGLQLAGALVGVLVLWLLLVQPALRTLREVPAQIDRRDAQLQQMQRLAAEARDLRGAPTVSPDQAGATLKTATERLGERARLTLLGDRATVTLSGVEGPRLRSWLAEVRSGARARVIDVQLTHGAQGYQGTVVLVLGGTS